MGSERSPGEGRGKGVYKRIADLVRDRRLTVFNSLFLPIIKSMGRYREIHRHITRRYESPIEVVDSIYEGVFAVSIKEPSGRRAAWVVYVSAQEWYITPSKVPSKARKVLEVMRRISVPGQYTYTAIVAKRATSGALRLAAQIGAPVRTAGQVQSDIRKYIVKRYTQLLAALRGRRVYGDLAALLYLLQEVAKEFTGPGIPTLFKDPLDAVLCYDKGCTVPSDPGPPTTLGSQTGEDM